MNRMLSSWKRSEKQKSGLAQDSAVRALVRASRADKPGDHDDEIVDSDDDDDDAADDHGDAIDDDAPMDSDMSPVAFDVHLPTSMASKYQSCVRASVPNKYLRPLQLSIFPPIRNLSTRAPPLCACFASGLRAHFTVVWGGNLEPHTFNTLEVSLTT